MNTKKNIILKYLDENNIKPQTFDATTELTLWDCKTNEDVEVDAKVSIVRAPEFISGSYSVVVATIAAGRVVNFHYVISLTFKGFITQEEMEAYVAEKGNTVELNSSRPYGTYIATMYKMDENSELGDPFEVPETIILPMLADIKEVETAERKELNDKILYIAANYSADVEERSRAAANASMLVEGILGNVKEELEGLGRLSKEELSLGSSVVTPVSEQSIGSNKNGKLFH